MSAIKLATAREGQSILRNGPLPDLEKIVGWMENAPDRNQRGRPEPTRRSFCSERYQRLHEALMERA
jgi:hypothetical protein